MTDLKQRLLARIEREAEKFTALAVDVNCKYSTDLERENYGFGIRHGYKTASMDLLPLVERLIDVIEQLGVGHGVPGELLVGNIHGACKQLNQELKDRADFAREALTELEAFIGKEKA